MGSHASPARADAQRAFDAIRRLVRYLRLAAARAEQRTGATAAQVFVLHQLATAPAASLAELAARTLTDASSVSTVVARLVEQGLVVRRRAAADRRRAELALTPKGRQALVGAPPPAQQRIVAAIAGMPPRDRRVLAEALEGLVASIGADDVPARMLFEDEPPRRRRR